MLETPEVEPRFHHKTGHSLADKILAVLAIFLSCMSVFIAVRHGQTMERLVAANSWPNISYSTGNESGGEKVIDLSLRNTGVGPARIDTLEVFYKGVAVSNAPGLLSACCGKGPHDISTSVVKDEVLPSRDNIDFLSLARIGNDVDVWNAFDKERLLVRVRICYCSVFEECWVRDTERPKPIHVDECNPSQPVQYR